jgi:phosphopantothenoylcysteine decarboxylase
MSDNLLTSVIRAWDTDASIDMKKKIIIVAPAMNSAMWRNPITEKQIRVLEDDWGVKTEECATGATRAITGWFQVLTVSISPKSCPQPLLTPCYSPSASRSRQFQLLTLFSFSPRSSDMNR